MVLALEGGYGLSGIAKAAVSCVGALLVSGRAVPRRGRDNQGAPPLQGDDVPPPPAQEYVSSRDKRKADVSHAARPCSRTRS